MPLNCTSLSVYTTPFRIRCKGSCQEKGRENTHIFCRRNFSNTKCRLREKQPTRQSKKDRFFKPPRTSSTGTGRRIKVHSPFFFLHPMMAAPTKAKRKGEEEEGEGEASLLESLPRIATAEKGPRDRLTRLKNCAEVASRVPNSFWRIIGPPNSSTVRLKTHFFSGGVGRWTMRSGRSSGAE